MSSKLVLKRLPDLARRATNHDPYRRFQNSKNLKLLNFADDSSDIDIPQKLLDNLQEGAKTGSLQYTASKSYHKVTLLFQTGTGIPLLLESLSNFYHPIFKHKYDPQTEITVTPGSASALHSLFHAFLDIGDQVITFDPSQEVHQTSIEYAGGKYVGIPLELVQIRKEREDPEKGLQNFQGLQDKWEIDWKQFQQNLGEKTKIFLLSNPHNPTGKVFTQEEINKLAEILKKHEHILIVQDETYSAQGLLNPHQPFQFPRFTDIPELRNRTVTVSDAGQHFSAQGLMLGYAIGDPKIISGLRAVHQYHYFCLNEPHQIAIAKTLDYARDNFNIFPSLQKNLKALIKVLEQSGRDFEILIPEGGKFLLTDIESLYIRSEGPILLFKDQDVVSQLQIYDKVNAYPLSLIDYTCRRPGTLVRWNFSKSLQTINQLAAQLN